MKASGVEKKRKQIIILTVIMVLAGLSSVLYGRYLKKTMDNAGIRTAETVTSDDIGRYVSIYIDQVELIEGGDGLYCIQVNLPND